MDPLSFPRVHYEFTISCANSPWIYCLSREFTILFAISILIHYLFCEFGIDSSSVPRITLSSLSVTRIHYPFRDQYGSINFFLNSELIYYFSREITLDQLSFPLIHYQFCEFTLDPSSVLRNQWEFIIKFVNYLWIYFNFRKFTLNLLQVSRIH